MGRGGKERSIIECGRAGGWIKREKEGEEREEDVKDKRGRGENRKGLGERSGCCFLDILVD